MKKEKIVQEFKDIKELIYNSAKIYANNIAFTVKHQEGKNKTYENITYKMLLGHINALGTKLYNMGLKNKRIAILGRNRYEWALGHLTTLLGGIVSIPLDKDLQIDELENSLIRSKADAIYFDEKYIEKIEEIKSRNTTNVKKYICMSKMAGYDDIYSLKEEGQKLLEEGNKEYISAKIDENAMNILLFTSGTTSKSKAVMLSHKNIASNLMDISSVLKVREDDRFLSFLPLHHTFECTTGFLLPLSVGASIAFCDGIRHIAENIKEYDITFMVSVPVLYENMCKKIMKSIKDQGKGTTVNVGMKVSNALLKVGLDIRGKLFKQVHDSLGSKLRLLVAGGAALDPDTEKTFNSLGINMVQGYGLTESSPVIAVEDDKYKKIGSIGKALPTLDVKIDKPNEEGIGELLVKGPTIMLGYYENEEATKETIDKEGWLHTGDLAKIDKDGFIFITGRKKFVIVLKNGKNIYPEELEILINKIAGVKECFVYGKPEDDGDYKISAKIVYDKEIMKEAYGVEEEKDIKEKLWKEVKAINKTMPKYKYIKGIIVTEEELIKTTTRKVKRNIEMKKITM